VWRSSNQIHRLSVSFFHVIIIIIIIIIIIVYYATQAAHSYMHKKRRQFTSYGVLSHEGLFIGVCLYRGPAVSEGSRHGHSIPQSDFFCRNLRLKQKLIIQIALILSVGPIQTLLTKLEYFLRDHYLFACSPTVQRVKLCWRKVTVDLKNYVRTMSKDGT